MHKSFKHPQPSKMVKPNQREKNTADTVEWRKKIKVKSLLWWLDLNDLKCEQFRFTFRAWQLINCTKVKWITIKKETVQRAKRKERRTKKQTDVCDFIYICPVLNCTVYSEWLDYTTVLYEAISKTNHARGHRKIKLRSEVNIYEIKKNTPGTHSSITITIFLLIWHTEQSWGGFHHNALITFFVRLHKIRLWEIA